MFSPERAASEATGHVCEMGGATEKNNMFSIIGIRVTPNSFAGSNLRRWGMSRSAWLEFFGAGRQERFFIPSGRNPLKRLIPKK
jgi:hypothetical protein